MEPLNSIPSTNNVIPEQTSFSFDYPKPYELPRRSISNCLRLKTNQSLDGRSSMEPTRQNNKYMKTQQSNIQNDQHYRRLAQEEYDMRTESLIKQYQLRINKQEEYYGLRQWKLKEQIDNLTNQNLLLNDQLKKVKLTSKNCQQRCSLCGDGQLLTHYNKILNQAQQHHKGCLVEKRQLSQKADEATAKYTSLEQEHEKVCQDVRSLSRQIRLYQKKVRQIEEERDLALQSVAEFDAKWKAKFQKLETDSRQLQKQLYQKDMELNQKKAFEQSRQSFSEHRPNSLKSSYIRQDRRQEKQNINIRNRTSIPKMIAMTEQGSYQKDSFQMHHDIFKGMKGPVRHEPLRWKYF